MKIDKKLIIFIFVSLVIICGFLILARLFLSKSSTPKDEFTIKNTPSYSVSAADKSGIKTMKITSSGTLTFNKPIKITELVMVGGGGAGGAPGLGVRGGGGGGGQVVTQKDISFTEGDIIITIGAGAYTGNVGWDNTAEASKVTNGGNTSVTLNGKTYTANGGKTALAPTGAGPAPTAKGGSGDGKGNGGVFGDGPGDGAKGGETGYGGGGGAGGISTDESSITKLCVAGDTSSHAGNDGGGKGAGWGGDHISRGEDGSPNTGGGGGGAAAITGLGTKCKVSESGKGADGVVIIKYTLV